MARAPAVQDISVMEVVAAHVRRLIFEGKLRRGERLKQDAIAADLGVSRIPVREAVVALDREGWVHLEPRRGASVLGLDHDFVTDHYRLLAEIYGLIARRATERGSVADAARLVDAAERVRVARSVDALGEANVAFFDLLIEVAGSPRLAAAPMILTSIVPGNFFEHVPGAIERQAIAIAAVAEAMRVGDGQLAGARVAALVREQGAAVVELLADRGILEDPLPPAARTAAAST